MLTLNVFLYLALTLQSISALQFSETVFDFGPRPMTQTELSHDFNFTNVSSDTVRLAYASTNCDCTKLRWTTGIIAPGQGGTVSILYSQDKNIRSFNQKVSVFVSGESAPYSLSFTGSFYPTGESLHRDFPCARGSVAFEDNVIYANPVYPGKPFSRSIPVANPGSSPHTLSLSSTAEGILFKGSSVTLDPVSSGWISVSFTADSLQWGLQSFDVIPVVDGEATEPLTLQATVHDDFSGMTDAELERAPRAALVKTYIKFPKARRGETVQTGFTLRNTSPHSPLLVRAVYSGTPGVECDWPDSVPAGSEVWIQVRIAPDALHSGKNNYIVKIVSNSPSGPILTQYIRGEVE